MVPARAWLGRAEPGTVASGSQARDGASRPVNAIVGVRSSTISNVQNHWAQSITARSHDPSDLARPMPWPPPPGGEQGTRRTVSDRAREPIPPMKMPGQWVRDQHAQIAAGPIAGRKHLPKSNPRKWARDRGSWALAAPDDPRPEDEPEETAGPVGRKKPMP